jgi:hypothetical protein
MNIHHTGVLAAIALSLSIVTSYAGPCSLEIGRIQDRVDAMIAATAAAGPSARETTAAKMHRQPTPNSIAAAEEELGEGAGAKRALAAIARARAADRAGNKSGCRRALANAQRAIAPKL